MEGAVILIAMRVIYSHSYFLFWSISHYLLNQNIRANSKDHIELTDYGEGKEDIRPCEIVKCCRAVDILYKRSNVHSLVNVDSAWIDQSGSERVPGL